MAPSASLWHSSKYNGMWEIMWHDATKKYSIIALAISLSLLQPKLLISSALIRWCYWRGICLYDGYKEMPPDELRRIFRRSHQSISPSTSCETLEVRIGQRRCFILIDCNRLAKKYWWRHALRWHIHWLTFIRCREIVRYLKKHFCYNIMRISMLMLALLKQILLTFDGEIASIIIFMWWFQYDNDLYRLSILTDRDTLPWQAKASIFIRKSWNGFCLLSGDLFLIIMFLSRGDIGTILL